MRTAVSIEAPVLRGRDDGDFHPPFADVNDVEGLLRPRRGRRMALRRLCALRPPSDRTLPQ